MVEEQERELGKISKALRDRSEPLLLGRLSVMLTHHRFARVHAFVSVYCVCACSPTSNARAPSAVCECMCVSPLHHLGCAGIETMHIDSDLFLKYMYQ